MFTRHGHSPTDKLDCRHAMGLDTFSRIKIPRLRSGFRQWARTPAERLNFVTFCCYHRRRLFTSDARCRIFESALERVRGSYRLCVYGYVVMPEHVHVLLGEPQQDTLADALKSLKQGVSRHLIGDAEHFWQKRYYDLNIRDYRQFVEKLRYIHRNPVKSGLCERPEEWEWSSFRHYATGTEGRVEIESEWTARKREHAAGRLCPAVELPHSSQNQP
jgi:putative transposase